MTRKENLKEINAMHAFLRHHYGRPTYCVGENCEGKSKWYDWAKKTDREYTRNPDDYLWLCRKCHRKYDMTPAIREQAIKNLSWVGRKGCWSNEYDACVRCNKTESKHKTKGLCTTCYNKDFAQWCSDRRKIDIEATRLREKKKRNTHPLVGRRVKCVSGEDYLGLEGTIEHCNTCCRAYRIQWDGIGNSIKLKDIKKHVKFI